MFWLCSDWYPPPTSFHVAAESRSHHRHHPELSTSSKTSGYPVHRHHHATLPHHSSGTRPPSHQHRQHSISSMTYSPHRFRSTTSPEAQNSKQAWVHRNRDKSQNRNSTINKYSSGNSRGRVEADQHVHGRSNSYTSGSQMIVSDKPLAYSTAAIAQSSSHVNPGMVNPGMVTTSGTSSTAVSISEGLPPAHGYLSGTQWDLSEDYIGQGSQLENSTFGRSQGYEGYTVDSYLRDTTSEHSFSESTQTSEISEPTYRRQRLEYLSEPSCWSTLFAHKKGQTYIMFKVYVCMYWELPTINCYVLHIHVLWSVYACANE